MQPKDFVGGTVNISDYAGGTFVHVVSPHWRPLAYDYWMTDDGVMMMLPNGIDTLRPFKTPLCVEADMALKINQPDAFTVKMVRDRLPGIGSCRDPHCPKNADTYGKLLGHKLMEEASEVSSAVTRDQLIEELADVAEVTRAILRLHGITPAQVELAQEMKYQKKGGFFNGNMALLSQCEAYQATNKK